MDADEDWPDDDEVPAEKWDASMKRVDDALTTERMREWGAKEPELSKDAEAPVRISCSSAIWALPGIANGGTIIKSARKF